jgi:predicted permease
MGIPLAQALFGSAGVFYAVVSLAVFNIFAWTHGTSLYQGPHSKNGWRAKAKAIIVNPNIAAILIGLAMFVLSIHFPSQINQFLTYVSDLFTPLSMIVIGSSLVDMPLRSVTFDLPIMISLLLRNLFYPVIAILTLKLFAVTGTAFTTSVILSSCPAAGMVVLFAMRNGDDTKPGVMLMSLSTILSLLTIPLVYLLSTVI